GGMARPVLPTLLAAAALIATTLIPTAHAGSPQPGTVDYTQAANRTTDPVVLTGKDLMTGSSQWSVPENVTAAVPSKDIACYDNASNLSNTACPDQTNQYVTPDADSSTVTTGQVEGTATDKILGYHWDPKANNNAGGF